MRRTLLVLAVVAGALWLAPGALAAWCGSGEQTPDRTDIVTGPQIHAVVAVPSDGADTFAADAGRIQDDVTSLSAWWTAQDPTRVPRFDLADFGGVQCLDISFLRLSQPASYFTSADLAFRQVQFDLFQNDLWSTYKKYLVYYDGPAPEQDVCGVGGGQFDSGPAAAIVLLAGCPGVPTDSIAAHELLHALGALPPGAPHACPGDAGHPCDSPTDILYPYTAGEPLSQKVLDYNHDDYYGHSGTWPDIQDSVWLHHLDTPEQALSIAFAGSGTVVSDVPGVDCTASCTTQWDQGSHVTLTAQTDGTTRFIGWQGGCHGLDPCSLTMSSAQSLTAVFGPTFIPIRTSVTGRGRIACSPACSTSFQAGLALSLRAVPAQGWRFRSWSGACHGTRPTCSPATDFALRVHATFARKPAKHAAKR